MGESFAALTGENNLERFSANADTSDIAGMRSEFLFDKKKK
jgi:hypothetical protein